jgi:hemoglobin
VAFLCLTLTVTAGAAAGEVPGPGHSLYERLGGQPVVAAVADDLIDRVLADARLRRSFEGSNIPRIKKLLAEQICSLTHGPCKYTGDSMRDVHAGHQITEAEFYGMVEQLRATLIAHGVPLRERNELLALLAPMKRDVVEDARTLRASAR